MIMSYLPTGSYEQDLGASFTESLTTFGKKAGSAVLDTFRTLEQQKGREQAFKEQAQMLAAQQGQRPGSGMPSWVIPAAIGGGVLVLILMMRKK
jgi:hypothetical protein